MAGEAGTFPDEAALLGKELGHLPADEFVRDGLVRVRVQFVLVAHVPGARALAVVIRHALDRVGVARPLGIKGVAVRVLFGADVAGALGGVGLEDGVVGAVDVGVHAQAEEVLVVVRVDARVDLGAPAFGVFARVHGVGVQDAG